MTIRNVILYPFGWIYGSVMAVRNFCYRSGIYKTMKVAVPVISIGNISVGGTGKTPMAFYLIDLLLTAGLRPAYLSRGYGRSTKGYLEVDPSRPDGNLYGDEALMVAGNFPDVPVVVCEDRVSGAEKLIAVHKPDCIILDDAFQHRRIARDLEIVMIDATRNPMSDLPLPAGRLREFRGGLGRADVIVLTKLPPGSQGRKTADLIEKRSGKPVVSFEMKWTRIFSFFTEDQLSPEELSGCAVVGFSGLGNNAYFRRMLENSAGELLAFHAFRDHYPFQKADIEKIMTELRPKEENSPKFSRKLILTTEKDYWRLKKEKWLDNFNDQPLYYVKAGLVPLHGEGILKEELKKILKYNE